MFVSTQVVTAGLFSVLAYFVYREYFLENESPIVKTKHGSVQGSISYSRSGREFYKYLGIPYAQPPVELLRFEPPKPAKSWSDIKKVKKFAPECMQLEIMATGRILGDEDCLYLNVFVPKVNSTKLLPVMFFIYGGLFMAGSGDLYSGEYFMDEDVVLVTFNYRVAALGFLNTDDDVVRGNMGLKDQRLAMQWVQQNIEGFGGDPKKVTIFGESAGGASVNMHMLSKGSSGLFHKAISQSGTAFLKWVINPIPHRPQAESFAKYFKCPTQSTQLMISCLRKVPAKELVRYHLPVMHPFRQMDDVFIPSIEKSITEDTFLSSHPLELIKKGEIAKVPWMVGGVADEGLYLAARLGLNKYVEENLGPKWNELAPLLLNYPREGNEEATLRIRKHYFGDKEIVPSQMLKEFSKLFSEYWFFVEQDMAVKLHLQHVPMHLYYLTYRSKLSLLPLFQTASEEDYIAVEIKMALKIIKEIFNTFVLGSPTPIVGTCHADDVPILFNFHPLLYITKDSEYYDISSEMVKTWVAFASDVSPLKFNGILWPQSKSGQKLQYLNLTMPGEIIDDPFKEVLKFWETVKLK